MRTLDCVSVSVTRCGFKIVPWASSPCRMSLKVRVERQFGTASMAVAPGYKTATRVMIIAFALIAFLCLGTACSVAQTGDTWTAQQDQDLKEALTKSLDSLNERIKATPDDLQLHSQRGDVHFYLGHFTEAVTDYTRMIELRPEEEASHWRRGIALFYAKEYADGAAQFEKYHSFDNVDRENGIWRYFCQVKAVGKEQAQRELLRYEKDDRPPFPEVYRLFSGKLTAEEVLASVATSSEANRQANEFYAHLYVGLNSALDGKQEEALAHLRAATDNPWPRSAGYGPRYMWHVGRLHLEVLTAEARQRD